MIILQYVAAEKSYVFGSRGLKSSWNESRQGLQTGMPW
jgi:hypothetical protein